MASPQARAIVQRFLDAGVSRSQLAAALERDASMVSQIARGARGEGYGAQLVPALTALERRMSSDAGLMPAGRLTSALRMVAETGTGAAPRRTLRGSDTLARVREGVKRAGPRQARLPGLYTKGGAGGRGVGLASILDRAEQTGQLVYLSVNTGKADGRPRRVGLGARTADEWRALGVDGRGSIGEQLSRAVGALGSNGELSSDVDEIDGFTASMVAEE